jgi:hypothetical protein
MPITRQKRGSGRPGVMSAKRTSGASGCGESICGFPRATPRLPAPPTTRYLFTPERLTASMILAGSLTRNITELTMASFPSRRGAGAGGALAPPATSVRPSRCASFEGLRAIPFTLRRRLEDPCSYIPSHADDCQLHGDTLQLSLWNLRAGFICVVTLAGKLGGTTSRCSP